MIRSMLERSRNAVMLAAIIAGMLLTAGVAHAAPVVEIEGPIGGAEVCVDGDCVAAPGVADVVVDVEVGLGDGLPTVAQTVGDVLGCTGNVNTTVTVDAALGDSELTVSFDVVDENGDVVDSQEITVPVPGLGDPVVVTVCGSLLG